MTRNELINSVATQCNMSQSEAKRVVGVVFDTITKELVTGEVRLSDFGVFKTKASAARQARNPRTGESITIAARNNVRFTAAKALKDAVAK